MSFGPAGAMFNIGVGDVLVIAGTSVTDKLIEAGAVAEGEPAASHVAGFHHWDKHGVPWGIEGRPGGVGWVDLRRYLHDPRTLTNAAQPKTLVQRKQLAVVSPALIGTDYDWAGGILADAWHDLGGPDMWKPDPVTGIVPAHVVCSSAWAWCYCRISLAAPEPHGWQPGAPRDWRHVQPGDWSQFITGRAWLR